MWRNFIFLIGCQFYLFIQPLLIIAVLIVDPVCLCVLTKIIIMANWYDHSSINVIMIINYFKLTICDDCCQSISFFPCICSFSFGEQKAHSNESVWNSNWLAQSCPKALFCCIVVITNQLPQSIIYWLMVNFFFKKITDKLHPASLFVWQIYPKLKIDFGPKKRVLIHCIEFETFQYKFQWWMT